MQSSLAKAVVMQPAAADAVFVVGQDRAGRWVAMGALGLAGGMFASRDAALCYAKSETGYRPGAVAFAAEPVVWR